jgi:hypothetical protein
MQWMMSEIHVYIHLPCAIAILKYSVNVMCQNLSYVTVGNKQDTFVINKH